MNAERWKQIDELFDAVLDLPEARREEFLSKKCNGDDNLKSEVLSLLKAQSGADKFMENSAMGIAAKNLADEQTILSTGHFLSRKLGTYQIESHLGAGGMGEVYLANDEKMKRRIALKILPAEFVADDERIRRFEMEARAVSALNHPNIVTIYDVGSIDGVNFIATEYVEGKTLREVINSGQKIKDTLNIIIQCCAALSSAHAAGIIHRDIKPENIMIRPDGYVKILDFGLVKLSDISLHTFKNLAKTAKGIIIGTPAYMSPEQISDDDVDHRTDLWSISVVLYELLTGTNPFKKDTRQATFQAILTEEPPLVSSLNAEISTELDQILIRALEKDADLSYQTASDLGADLKRIKREIDSSVSLQGSSKSLNSIRGEESRQNSGWMIPVFGLLLLALAAGIWFIASKYRQTEDEPDWSRAKSVSLTDQAGIEFFPSLSPDGKTFIYSKRGENGNLDIFSQRVGGKNPVNRTPDSAADDTQPAFSPDGESIAFHSEREHKGIYIMGASGENPRRVADFGFQPSWSPDGNNLVVSTSGPDLPNLRNAAPSSLWIINIESGEKRMLIEKDAMQPSWSPDGKRIAYWFMHAQSGKRDVATIPVEGGEPKIISKEGMINWNPVWSPDGKFLYYASDMGGNMNFWRVRINENGEAASEPKAVVTPSKYSRHLAFSADGKRMVYVQTDISSNIQAVNFDAKTEKPLGDPFWITRGDRQISRAELSPDGRQFVVRIVRRTQDDIVLINRETGEISDLTNDVAFDRYPRWSPDGKKIAFISDRGGSHEIWTIDADGTNPKQITFNKSKGTTFPHWSPDGNRILYRFNQQNYIVDLNKNWNEQKPSALPTPPKNAQFTVWDWSPDGKMLIGSLANGLEGIGFYAFDTNHYELTSDIEEIPSWLPDSRRISFTSKNKVYIQDVFTKKVTEVPLSYSSNIQIASVSRDGTLLYFTVVSNESDIWMLDYTEDQ